MNKGTVRMKKVVAVLVIMLLGFGSVFAETKPQESRSQKETVSVKHQEVEKSKETISIKTSASVKKSLKSIAKSESTAVTIQICTLIILVVSTLFSLVIASRSR
jgi:Flp pilus assembly protein TadB